MNETYSELDTAFSTADTIGRVSMRFVDDCLTVDFIDEGNTARTVLFEDTRSFSWKGWEGDFEVEPDRVYEMKDTGFLDPWTAFSVQGKSFHRYKLGFVSEGKFIDVIATRMTLKEA